MEGAKREEKEAPKKSSKQRKTREATKTIDQNSSHTAVTLTQLLRALETQKTKKGEKHVALYSSNKTKLVSQKVLSSFFFPPPPVSDLPGKEEKRAKNTPQKNHTKITENTPLSSLPFTFLPPCNFICHMICYCNLLFHFVEQNPTHFFIHPPP